VLAQVLSEPVPAVTEALQALSGEYTEAKRGFDLREVAGGWRLYTREEYADLVGTPESMALIPPDRKVIDQFRCPDPFQRMALFVNGDLFGCCSDHGREYPWGNALQDDVGAVWRSEVASRLRDLHRQGRWYDHPACRACGLASVARLPATAA